MTSVFLIFQESCCFCFIGNARVRVWKNEYWKSPFEEKAKWGHWVTSSHPMDFCLDSDKVSSAMMVWIWGSLQTYHPETQNCGRLESCCGQAMKKQKTISSRLPDTKTFSRGIPTWDKDFGSVTHTSQPWMSAKLTPWNAFVTPTTTWSWDLTYQRRLLSLLPANLQLSWSSWILRVSMHRVLRTPSSSPWSVLQLGCRIPVKS